MTLRQQVYTFLQSSPHTSFLIAYSGGLDSTVLLHAFKQLQQQDFPHLHLRAIHFNHGLNQHAVEWQLHAQKVCDNLDIPLVSHALQLHIQKGESVEAIARDARYAICAQVLEKNEILCTAHHQDDQLETVLLQLLRGAGPKGLAAMAALDSFASGYLARPLLSLKRETILAYAHEHQLNWVEDDSNTHTVFDRNFLRHQVIPVLQQRFPAAAQTASRSAQHCASAQQLLDEYLVADLMHLAGSAKDTLSRRQLAQFSIQKQGYLLRAFMSLKHIPLPSTVQLTEILALIKARPDAHSRVTWQGYSARFYRDDLYINPNDFFAPIVMPDTSWNGLNPLSLPNGSLQLLPAPDGQLKSSILQKSLVVRFRPHTGSSLKKILQEAGIPPWQRWQLPFIYADGELVAIGANWIAPSYRTAIGEAGLSVSLLY